MNEIFLFAVMLFVAGVILRAWLLRVRRHAANPIGRFGSRGRGELTEGERRLILNEQAKIRRWAFVLAWLSMAIGLAFGTVLIGRYVFAQEVDLLTLSSAAGIAGDIGLASSAFRLYKAASSDFQATLALVRNRPRTMDGRKDP